MPLKGTCLLFDTELKEALQDAVKLMAFDNLQNNKSASVGAIFAQLRKADIEVDLPTVGEIYNNVLPRDDANFSSETEIEDYVGKTWSDDISKIVEMEDLVGEEQIGEEKPERAVVEMIIRSLYNDVVTDNRTTSDMKALQKALSDGIKRKLGKLDGKKATKQDMVTIINEALGWENMGVTDLNGHLNSIEDLFNNMRRELQNASEEIRDAADPNVADRWDEYIKNLETATYQLLFRKSDALKVRDEALIKNGFGMKRGGKDVLDWNKLSAYGSLSTLRKNSYNAFVDAGFTTNQATRITDALHQEYLDIRAEAVEKQTQNPDSFAKKGKTLSLNNAGLKKLLARKSMAEWIKEQKIETIEQLEERAYDELNKTEYTNTVKDKAVELLTKFFDENYAKVETEEARREIENMGIIATSGKTMTPAAKPATTNKTVIDWIKENGIQNQDELYAAIDKELAGRPISTESKDAIKAEFKRILDINNKAEKELKSKQEAAEKYEEKEYKPTKSDLKRLIELYHLGVFESAYNSSLFRTLGVGDLTINDMNDIRAVAETASKLARKVADVKGYNLYNDSSVSTLFQTLQRDIDTILQRNINNKSVKLKVVSFISNYLNAMLSSLLAMPTTMVQNIFSGFKAVLTGLRTNTTNFSQTKDSLRLFGAMLADVTKTGQAYGEEVGSFATRELYLNTLKFKWKGGSISDKAKSILLGITMPIRIGLLAFDSANKVALSNKIFYNQMHNALMKIHTNWTSHDANSFLNEALYGKSLDDAKVLAKKIAEETNASLPSHLRHKITGSYIARLANDIVKANVITQGGVQKDQMGVVDALVKGAYHVAGVSLGHEPNNYFSKFIKTYRDGRKRNEDKFVKDRNWDGLARHRFTTTLMNNFVIQFAGGATNWLVLRASEGLPFFGVARGMAGGYNKKIEYLNTGGDVNKNLKQDVIERERARSDIARNIIGMTYAFLFSFLGYSLLGGGDDEEAKKRLKELNKKQKKSEKEYAEIEALKEKVNVYTALKSNRSKEKWFRTMAPDLHLMKYYIETAKGDGKIGTAQGLLSYVTRSYQLDDRFSVTGKLRSAGELLAQGDFDAAMGTIFSIAGDKVSVPMYRPGKEYIRVVTNPFRDDPVPPSRYVPPTNPWEGLFGSGLMQDLGLWDNPSITALPGIGPAAYNRFKALGISKVDDLKENWEEKKDGKGYILPVSDRAKAKKWLEDYKKADW